MGVYLNPGCYSFEEALNSDIYVDKTEMLLYLNSVIKTNQKYLSVSRPRRFGKSMAANMICAYYGKADNNYDLFKDRKLAKHDNWDFNLGKYNVIHIVMTKFFKNDIDVCASLEKMQTMVIRDICKEFPSFDVYDKKDLVQTMDDFYAEFKQQFVIVIDEWDAVFRVRKDDKEGQTKYLDFLRDWLKDKNYIALAYMTGILPIKKYGEHSALNMFDEYSMIQPMQLASYSGFTEDEVEELCNAYGRNFNDIKEWYDGYDVCDVIPPDPNREILKSKHHALYSPLSVVKALRSGIIDNYWNKTETYEALAEYIRRDYDGLKETVALLMDGGRVKIDISKYQNDMTTFAGKDDILTLLIHLGYLGYDNETREVFIPNKEILDVFKTSTDDKDWVDTFEEFKISQELLDATWAMDEQKVAKLVEAAHDKADNKTYNDEAALSYAIKYAYYAAQKYYTTIQELDSGKGYADIVFIPSPRYSDKPAIVIELKYDKNAETAINQIKNRNYPDVLSHYKENILLVGINYNKDALNTSAEFKHHECKIERG